MMTVKQFIKKYVATQEQGRAENDLDEIVEALENRSYNQANNDARSLLRGVVNELKERWQRS